VIRILDVERGPRLDAVRELLLEYTASLDFDLAFQGFDLELVALPGDYAPPHGRLLLALDGDHPAGCVAFRRLEQDVCEMKRLYLREGWRGRGLGRALAEEAVVRARQAGYARMRLDTVPAMRSAIGLYRALGFTEIAPYCHNPVPGATFFELALVRNA